MSGLLETLQNLQHDDANIIMDALLELNIDEELEKCSDTDQQAIRPILNDILEKLEEYQTSLEAKKQDAITKIDAAEKMSDACVAYTKGKRKDKD